MKRKSRINGFAPARAAVIIFVCTAAIMPLHAQAWKLSAAEAVSAALSEDSRITGALFDVESGKARLEEARFAKLPSLSLNAGYTRLSPGDSQIDLGVTSIAFKTQEDAYTLGVNFQYPVFAGFRLEQAVEMARLNESGKEAAYKGILNAVAFETRRAYWEAFRAERGVVMFTENLALAKRNEELTKSRYEEGTVLQADLLAAVMRSAQAEMDLENAEMHKEMAFLSLSAAVSEHGSTEAVPDFTLTSEPGVIDLPDDASFLNGALDDTALLENAASNRSEMKAAAIAESVSAVNTAMSKAPLYPTLALRGNYTYANPNSQVPFSSGSGFIGTWNLGVSLSYDIGAVPKTLAAAQAGNALAAKQKEDSAKVRERISLDVRNCLLVFRQTGKDIASLNKVLEQARENERVTGQRLKSGTAGDIDALTASVARMKAEYAIVSRQIDRQIAAADLYRALGYGADRPQ